MATLPAAMLLRAHPQGHRLHGGEIARFCSDRTCGKLYAGTPRQCAVVELGMIRPKQIAETRALSQDDRDALAKRARYVGSCEHKKKRSWLGLPKAGSRRRKTTICELVEDEDKCKATTWVRSAIRSKQCKFVRGDKDFPKHVWYKNDGQTWYGRCTNSVSGEYKGWSISEEERCEIFD